MHQHAGQADGRRTVKVYRPAWNIPRQINKHIVAQRCFRSTACLLPGVCTPKRVPHELPQLRPALLTTRSPRQKQIRFDCQICILYCSLCLGAYPEGFQLRRSNACGFKMNQYIYSAYSTNVRLRIFHSRAPTFTYVCFRPVQQSSCLRPKQPLSSCNTEGRTRGSGSATKKSEKMSSWAKSHCETLASPAQLSSTTHGCQTQLLASHLASLSACHRQLR